MKYLSYRAFSIMASAMALSVPEFDRFELAERHKNKRTMNLKAPRKKRNKR